MSLIEEQCEKRVILPPKNIMDIDSRLFVRSKNFFSIKVYIYPEAYVTGSGICFNRFLGLLKGSYSCISKVKRDQFKIAIFNFFFRKKIVLKSDKQFLVVHNQWYSGYFHWLIDTLTRLFEVERLHEQLCLLLPEKAKQISFIEQTLALFPKLERKYIPTGKVAFVESLLVPSHLPDRGMFVSEKTKALRNYILSALDITLGNVKKKVYVSRRSSNRRRIINEGEVLDLIGNYGFEQVLLEELNFSEQVRLFASTQTVLSIHGAGLSNIIFMSAGCNVVEIFKKPVTNEVYELDYHVLASEFELKYYALLGSPNNVNDSFDRADLFVDLNELKKVLEHLTY